MKRILCLMLVLVMVLALGACGGKEAQPAGSEAAADLLAGKNMSEEDAKYEIEVAMQYLLEQIYGDKVNDARIYVEKIYSADEEKESEMLKDYNLGADEYAFEVQFELHPADGVDPVELTAANGEVNEESGWVVDKYNVGVLRPNADGSEPAYVIDNFGTAF